MTDPFDVLRSPVLPVAPDPAFAAHLRSRLERALTRPKGAVVSNLTLQDARQGDIGYLSLQVPDVERAANFFGAVLGWSYEPGSGPQGRHIMGASPHHGIWGGQARSNVLLCYFVYDVDAALQRVRTAGGSAETPSDEPYGRVANCVDDQGLEFAIFHPPGPEMGSRGQLHGGRQGDVAYVTLEVVDSARARAFYGAVLGWRFVPGRVDDGWQTTDVVPMTGMHGGHPQATVVPMYQVDDVDAAAEGVRRAGGSASDPQDQPYGRTTECTDDQGTRFYLGQI
jgi:predicted enzyme related to lactoylglutathione lyase